MKGMHISEKELSTSALAKELNVSSNYLFQRLADDGLIVRKDNDWELTVTGRAKGGLYLDHDIYGRYIAWPKSLKTGLDGSRSDANQQLLTSTTIGKHFEISATRTNYILFKLGLIEKGIKGWLVTQLGKKWGGVQSQDKVSGVQYVRWPESIINNKMLIASIGKIKGEVTIADQNRNQTPSTNEAIEFRDKFKPTLRATDGHYVRSKAELLIDNWLYMSELVHAYERKLPIEEEVYSDFYIPKGKVYIEYWGFDEDTKYASRKAEKLAIYKKYDFHLIQLAENEVQNLDDTLPRLLLAF